MFNVIVAVRLFDKTRNPRLRLFVARVGFVCLAH